jgi:hypothetical protein
MCFSPGFYTGFCRGVCTIMIDPQHAQRLARIRVRVDFYRQSLKTILLQTDDKKLNVLIHSTLRSLGDIEADPLYEGNHGRRSPALMSKWLDSIEGQLYLVDKDYKILVYFFEHPEASRSVRVVAAHR